VACKGLIVHENRLGVLRALYVKQANLKIIVGHLSPLFMTYMYIERPLVPLSALVVSQC